VINQSQYETQFDVKLETIQSKDGKKNEVKINKEKKMTDRKRQSLQKHKDKCKFKRIKKEIENEKFNSKFVDKVKFGEVVHQPPMITITPRLPKQKMITKGLLYSSKTN
jgi:hypothetical protein